MLQRRVTLSVLVIFVFSMFHKLFSSSLTLNIDTYVRDLVYQCMQIYSGPHTPHRNAVCLGMCMAARTLMDDVRIERCTGVNMAKFIEKLNKDMQITIT